MKIGIDIRTLMDKEYSGVSEYTYNLVKNILAQDKNNEYCLFYNSGRDISEKMPKFAGGNIRIVSTRYPNKIFNNIMQPALGRPKIDQLLGVDLFFMPNIAFASLSEAARKIITIHDLSFMRYQQFYSWKRRLWHWAINIKKILNKFDIIVAVSENTKKDIIELCGIKEEKIKVIYSGLGDEFRIIHDRDKLAAIKKKYQLPEKFILYLGTIEPRKNVDSIIQAFGRLLDKYQTFQDYELIIAGARGWKNKEIHRSWHDSRHESRIKIIGYVDKLDKAALYNLAKLFIYPSYYEGFGFPPLEAMACSVPVIVSASSSLPEIVKTGAVLINPFNISEITTAMQQVLSSVELKKQLTRQGLNIARSYNWRNSAKEYLQLFQN